MIVFLARIYPYSNFYYALVFSVSGSQTFYFSIAFATTCGAKPVGIIEST